MQHFEKLKTQQSRMGVPDCHDIHHDLSRSRNHAHPEEKWTNYNNQPMRSQHVTDACVEPTNNREN